MFGIGTMARLAGVSVRTLRYYDERGLLRPLWVDPRTGYRWYAPGQMRRLHRILVLGDLGVRLAEMAVLLDDNLSAEELRGILRLRRAEAKDRLAADAQRLARVEARLAQMEETNMPEFDVLVKRTEPEWVLTATEQLSGLGEIEAAHGRLWDRLHRTLEELGIERVPPSIAVERGSDPIALTAALPVPGDLVYDQDGIVTEQLAGLDRAATTVLYGNPDFHGGYAALRAWAEETGESATGEWREVYLDCDGPRDTWVVELQLALRQPSPVRSAALA